MNKDRLIDELADWFVKYRKPITARSLKPILKRHITTTFGYQELIDYLSSKAGRASFGSAVKAKLLQGK